MKNNTQELSGGDLPGHAFHGNQHTGSDASPEVGNPSSYSSWVKRGADLPAEHPLHQSNRKLWAQKALGFKTAKEMTNDELERAASVGRSLPEHDSTKQHLREISDERTRRAFSSSGEKHLTGKVPGHVLALTAIAGAPIAAALPGANARDRWLVYVPKGDRAVPQKNTDGTPYELRVNPTPLSAKRMEGARRKMMSEGGVKPYTDYDHKDEDASGAPLRFAWHEDFGVIGLTRLTAKAVERTTGEPPEYQSFSPHVPMDPETGEAVGLFANCGGFVNRGLFGAEALLSATARLSASLVAADPNDVARISAAPGDVETEHAAQNGAEQQMKELKAKLCAAWKLDPEKATEAELIAAWDTHAASVTTLTAKAGLVEPVIVALGFDKAATPKPEELTGKIADLGKKDANVIMLADYAKELTALAVGIGLISPAEKETWERRIKNDHVNEVKELTAKKPAVPLGTVVVAAANATAANSNGAVEEKWEKPLAELVAKDGALSEIAVTDMPRAKSLGLVRLMQQQPELFKK